MLRTFGLPLAVILLFGLALFPSQPAAAQQTLTGNPLPMLSFVEVSEESSRSESELEDSEPEDSELEGAAPVVLEAPNKKVLFFRRHNPTNIKQKKFANAAALNKKAMSKSAPQQALNRATRNAADASPLPAVQPSFIRGSSNQPSLSRRQQQLRNSIDATLSLYARRIEHVGNRNCWEIMHWLIGYGMDAKVEANGRSTNAITWLCRNGRCKGTQLFHLSGGQLQASVGVGVQGHHGQFLAMLAQSNVKQNFPIRIDGRKFTVDDLIKFEQENCRAGEELTFKLIAFSHYLPLDSQWRSKQRQKWDIPRLIQEELKQPVVGAACGGTHRLMGISYAVRKREASGEPMSGQWKRAEKYVDDFQKYTLQLQNRDGSFSTDWFKGRADSGDNARKFQTTGHIVEWLTFSLSEEELHGPSMTKAIRFLTALMRKNSRKQWEIGPQGHAIRALRLYRERAFPAPALREPSQENAPNQELADHLLFNQAR